MIKTNNDSFSCQLRTESFFSMIEFLLQLLVQQYFQISLENQPRTRVSKIIPGRMDILRSPPRKWILHESLNVIQQLITDVFCTWCPQSNDTDISPFILTKSVSMSQNLGGKPSKLATRDKLSRQITKEFKGNYIEFCIMPTIKWHNPCN